MTATTEKLPYHPVFTALDTISPSQARAWTEAVRPHVGGIKVGLEFFTANGPAAVRDLANIGLPVFLDLKLHDIPNTVAGAVRAIAPLSPSLLTVHASGGPAMIKAAVDAAHDAAQQNSDGVRTRIVAVTVLTSLDDRDLDAVGQRGPALDQVLRLADTALEAGADGVVASPRELPALRQRFGDDPLLVIPGIRRPGQRRAIKSASPHLPTPWPPVRTSW